VAGHRGQFIPGGYQSTVNSDMIIPVTKDQSDDLTDSKNYRGITLYSVLFNVFELLSYAY